MKLTRAYHGVMIKPHKQHYEMLEVYTNKGGRDILWGVVPSDVLDELIGNISISDLENHEDELCRYLTNGGEKAENKSD